MTTLSDLARTVTDHARVATELADQVDDLRDELPPGAAVAPDVTGVRRPVESLVVAVDTRGGVDHMRAAETALHTAERATRRATEELNATRRIWHAPESTASGCID